MSLLNPSDYTVVWIAVLSIEAEAALRMLNRTYKGRFPMQRGNDYIFFAGDLGGHNIAIATLPEGREYNTGAAAALASQAHSFFPNLWFSLLVGVAAGLPNLAVDPPLDIRLGDVLVAVSDGDNPDLVVYELDREERDHGLQLVRRGQVLANTEAVVLSTIRSIKLRNDPRLFLRHYDEIRDKKHGRGTFRDPGQELDILYGFDHDEKEYLIQRTRRSNTERVRV